MQAYKDKLHAALREIAECPVSMRTVEQAAAVTDLLCRLDKLEGHACQEELKIIHALTKPKYFIPVHGEQRMLQIHKRVAESMGIQAPVVPRWAWGVTMNMMYSDYYPVAVEFGLNRPEFYAALAKAFLLDKDGPGPEQKLMAYYEHIARS